MTGFVVPTCKCWHTAGDHVSGGTGFPHPPQHGPCLVPGCGCTKFRDANESDDQQEKAA